MRVLYINNGGGGWADYIQVPEGQTVERFFAERMPAGKPEDYLIRVNRQPVSRDTVLQGKRPRDHHPRQSRRRGVASLRRHQSPRRLVLSGGAGVSFFSERTCP